jgi:hypothetical protein
MRRPFLRDGMPRALLRVYGHETSHHDPCVDCRGERGVALIVVARNEVITQGTRNQLPGQ